MKGLKFLAVAAVALSTAFGFSSCSDDDGYSLDDVRYTIATAVPDGQSVYFRTDNGDKLWAANINGPILNIVQEKRAQIFFTILSDSISGFDHYIQLRSLDTLLTKGIAPNLGVEKNDEVYGKDKVMITDMWIGDGYLNVFFKTYFAGPGYRPQYINVVPTENDEYTLEFRHNAYRNPQNYIGTGAVAFKLSTLPDTQGETVKLKIKVNTFDGDKEYTLDYNSDKSKQPQGSKRSHGSSTENETLNTNEIV